MKDWRIGQKLVCINEIFPLNMYKFTLPKKDDVYTIREFVVHPRDGTIHIMLCEIKNPMIFVPMYDGFFEAAFLCERFLPVKETNIDIFLQMLNDIPASATLETV